VPAGHPYRVLVAGAGVAGLECVLALRALAEERVEIEVLSPEGEFTYRPLSVAEPFGAGEAFRVPLSELLSPVGARHRADALAAVDAARRRATTVAGDVIEYEALVVACGGQPGTPLPGAVVFHGAAGRDALRGLLDELAAGRVRRVVFAVPSGTAWALPLYELALLTATYLEAQGRTGVELSLLTPERAPLALFGPAASEAVGDLLDLRGIAVVPGVHPIEFAQGSLRATGGITLAADRVVSIPRLVGPRLPGLPCDAEGFIPATEQGAVRGLRAVYAAGDAVSFPIKQGGIAAQQADAVAEVLAARAGVALTPRPFRPVLRGLLLTGGAPRYLRAEPTSGHGDTSEVAPDPLWWPPSKVAGRHLAPFLAELAGRELVEAPPIPGAVRVEREVGGTEAQIGSPER
jgi:sulfide:quinone oxidoreductase